MSSNNLYNPNPSIVNNRAATQICVAEASVISMTIVESGPIQSGDATAAPEEGPTGFSFFSYIMSQLTERNEREIAGVLDIPCSEILYVASLFVASLCLLGVGHKLHSRLTQFVLGYIFFIWLYVLCPCEKCEEMRVMAASIMGVACGWYACRTRCVGKGLIGFICFAMAGCVIGNFFGNFHDPRFWYEYERYVVTLMVIGLGCYGVKYMEMRDSSVSRCGIAFITAHLCAESFALLASLLASCERFEMNHGEWPVNVNLSLRPLQPPRMGPINQQVYSSWEAFSEAGLQFSQLYLRTPARVDFMCKRMDNSVPLPPLEVLEEQFGPFVFLQPTVLYVATMIACLYYSVRAHNREVDEINARIDAEESANGAKATASRRESVMVVVPTLVKQPVVYNSVDLV
jgi:hypothetical protein